MFAIAVVYAISRVIFLPLGYGLDDDAWLVARAGDILAHGGGYVASRLPGYPSVELIVGGLFSLFGTSAVLGNLAASLAGLALMIALWVLLGRRGRRSRCGCSPSVRSPSTPRSGRPR